MKKNESRIQVGKRIRKFRQARNMSQRELSRKINVARSTLAHYELGDRMPDISILWDIADHLDVSLDELVGRNKSTE